MIRTRFAPSPTGFMHLGNLRTALYAYFLAKSQKGKFILRIEDTDRARYVEGAVEAVYKTLRECGINWDEGPDVGGDYAPYIQSERKGAYMDYALELIEKGAAYYCVCASEDIKAGVPCPCKDLTKSENEKLKNAENRVIRQRIPKGGKTTFSDKIYGEITVDNSEIEDQTLIKSDDMPTYNFANVIDDHSMNINLVTRGNEYLSSTPKYNLLYEAFGWEIPEYVHLPPIMRDASHKLSKRDGDAYFEDFRAKGYLTSAIVNYIALLGWSPGGENEIFSLSELEEIFSESGISKSPAIFDEAKMKAINAEHIRRLSPEDFKKIAVDYIPKADINYDVLTAALQPRTEILSDIPPQVDFIAKVCDYTSELYNNKKMKTSFESAPEALNSALRIINETNLDKDALYNAFKTLAETNEKKIGWYLYPLQVALTGKASAPGGGLDVCVTLGKEEAVKRIKTAIGKLEKNAV